MLKDFLTDFAISLSFISRVPIKLKNVENWEERLKRIPIYFPAIGYVPGVIYVFGILLAQRFSDFQLIFILLAMTFGYYFFDLFHFDGLLDMLDGFLNQSTKERRLEIMSKGDVGPFAVFYGTLYVLIFYQLTFKLPWQAFLYASVFGRYEMSVLLAFSKPAKPKGLGAMLFPYNKVFTVYSTIFLVPLFFVDSTAFFFSFFMSVITAYVISKLSDKKIGGITGDVLGGSCLISQIFILMIFYLF